MRVLLRVLAPLLGLALAAVGVLTVIEVVAAWVRTPATAGLLVPWPDWRTSLESLTWADAPVPGIAIGVAVLGLLLLLIGLLARRHDIALTSPAPEVAVTTSPRVLARLVGRRVRAADGVAAASVTATGRKVAVGAQAWNDSGSELRSSISSTVDTLLDELPLARRPRVAVTVQQRKGPR
ncbi:DUF6286 domain-containing protein [Pseudonocardia abyssalis]|uniref:DUF6286 domain-containing protein n=1 Tax=Pseudonocardia abyssalis TaxID=2792008 RepID=A0ABS6UMN8_9PSEU|nr:DUF6286 domain-containing protein [Pseudonocardia abyssalis]MBW0118442.1 hypothetical protein [Pseudonocardia abyssalis]MBW0133506.1 hypothetical protein [Pseudonocardia abyssalis]